MQFQNTTLSAEMLQAIATQNFTEMTEIQAKTIPLLLEHLEENDDVQNVYHNWSMPEDIDE
ncbi:MAG: YebC/PmpR family DNA-binding transcriptional regulator [Ruminococcus sp.]